MAAARLLLVTLVAAAALSAPAPAAALDCPTDRFLRYGYVIYASKPIPASISLAAGTVVGQGMIDEPLAGSRATDRCERNQEEVDVLRLGDVDPRVAVAVAGRPGLALVLGGRCSGYEGDAYWSCLTEPLSFRATSYTGIAYPAGADRGTLPLGGVLGEAQAQGETVGVVAVDGVDPAIAVAIEGRPSEVFVAPGVCPYERFSNTPADDDLSRCLRAPVWLVFDPPGARVGDEITAHTDRDVAGAAAGAPIRIARATEPGNAVPSDLSDAVAVASVPAGPAGSAVGFEVPDVAEGIYEAVVTCQGCTPSQESGPEFPAGSLVAFGKKGSTGLIVTIVIGLGFVALLTASVVIWRRGYRIKRTPRRA